MKRTSLKLKVAVALLLVAMMLFSVVAVTAFAATSDVPDKPDEEYETRWYTISYTDPVGDEPPELRILLSADYRDYSDLSRVSIYQLMSEIESIAMRYIKQNVSLFSTNETAAALVYSLASAGTDAQNQLGEISDADKELLKNALGFLGITIDDNKPVVDSVKEFLNDDKNKESVQSAIESVASSTDTIIKTVAYLYASSADPSENITPEDVAEKFESIIDVVVDNMDIVDEVLDLVYENEEEKPETVTNVVEVLKKDPQSEEFKEFKENVSSNAQTGANVAQGGSFVDLLTKEDVMALLRTFKGLSVRDGDATEYEELITLNGLDIGFNYDLAKKLIRDIPMPGEMADYSSEQLANLFHYDVKVDFGFLSLEMDITIGFKGDCSDLQELLGLVSNWVDVSLGENNTLVVGLTVPDDFAELVLLATKADMIPDYYKHKIFAALDKNGEDVKLFLSEDLTFDEIITILSKIPYDELFTQEYKGISLQKIAEFLHLDDDIEGLDKDKLIDRLSQYGELYNSAINMVVNFMDNYVDERFMNKTISDFYDSDTNTFHVNEDITLTADRINKVVDKAFDIYFNHLEDNVEDFIGKYETLANKKWIYDAVIGKAQQAVKLLVENVFDSRESITVGLDLTVEFKDIYQVTYNYAGGRVVHGFLPVGADIDFFGNNANVPAWVDANGNVVREMPTDDVELYPIGYGFGVNDIVISGGYEDFVEYNKENTYTLSASVNADYNRLANSTVTFKWYKLVDGTPVLVGETSTVDVKNVADNGEYYYVATLRDTELGVDLGEYESEHFTVKIAPKKIVAKDYINSAKWIVKANGVEVDWQTKDGKNYVVYAEDGVTYTVEFVITNSAAVGATVNGYASGSVTEASVIKADGYLAQIDTAKIVYSLLGEYDSTNYELDVSEAVTFDCDLGIYWYILEKTTTPINPPVKDEGEWLDGNVSIKGDRADEFTVNVSANDYSNLIIELGNKIGKVIVAYDITPYAGYAGGVAYDITFVIPADYKNDTTLKIYHIVNGHPELVESTIDSNSGTITFKANSFSDYAIVAFEDKTPEHEHVFVDGKCECGAKDPNYVPPITDPSDEEPKSKWWIWLLVVLGVLLVAGGVVLAIILIKRRKEAKALEEALKEEGDPVPTTPSVGEAAVEVPEEITSADAESPESEVIAEVPVTEVAEEAEPEVEEVADEVTVAEPAVESVVDEIAIEEPVAEEPVVEEPVVEEPVVEEPVAEEPVVEELVVEEPVVEEPVVEEPVAEEPVVEEPVAEEPVAEEPVVEEPVVEEPVVEEPVVEEPVAEEPAVEEPVVEEPVVEEPVAEEPAVEEPAAAAIVVPSAEENEDNTDSVVVDGEVVYVHYRSSFTSRLIQANSNLQDYYTTIKNYILSYAGIKAKASWNYEIFTKGRTQCVKINVKGKSLTLHLALDPKEYSVTKYHFTDLSDNPKFAKLPMLLKVRSDRALKYALELIADVMKNVGVEQGEIPTVDYHMPYESNASLAKRGIVKVILPEGVQYDPSLEIREANVADIIDGGEATVTREEVFLYDQEEISEIVEDETEETAAEEAPVAETPTEEAVVEETVEAEPDVAVATETASVSAGAPVIIGENTVDVGGNVVLIRYRSSFTSRLIQSDNDIQDYYTALKNHLLSYKGVKSRTSWNYETFSRGRDQLARINIKGKTLTINLALVPQEYNASKYHFTDLSDDPKFDKLPMLLKVRSARALKYALELIGELMKSLDIPVGKVQNVDYHKPYEANSSLAKRGLMKIILPAGVKLDQSTVLLEEDVDSLIDSHKQESEAPAAAETPVVEAPAEEAPVEETPVEEAPAEEAPIEEAPAEEAPVEETPVEEAPVEEHHEIFTDAVHADEMVSDDVAEHSIEVIKKARSGKMVEVNIDEICANFEDGETVTLDALKAKRIVNKSAGRLKVLANGTMTKCLTVEADKFSLQAVKMITLAGGVAKKYV